MAAPKKNEFWKERSKHGRDKIFKTPETFEKAIREYFQWNVDNPLQEEIIQGGERFTIDKMRAMTKQGLCVYLNITVQAFDNYGANEDYKDFFAVYTWARQVMFAQKFEGAAAGFLKENLIARETGLSDKAEVKQNTTIEYKNVSTQFPGE